jgi:hypothetical protein
MPEDVWIALLLRTCVFIGCAGPLALVLHRSRLPGGRPAAVVAGGILAGILLGPGVAGAVVPAASSVLFLGGEAERKALQELDLEQEGARTALGAVGASPEAMGALIADQEAVRGPVLERLNVAREWTRVMTGSVMVGLVSVAVGLGAWVGVGGRDGGGDGGGDGRQDDSRTLTSSGLRSTFPLPGGEEGEGKRAVPGSAGSVVGDVAVAAGVVMLALVPTGLLLQWLFEMRTRDVVAIGAVVAAGSLFGALPLRWMPRLARAGRDAGRGAGMMQRVGMFGAFGAAGALAWSIEPSRLGFVLVPAVAIGVGSSVNHVRRPGVRARRWARRVVLWVCLPACAAYLARAVDTEALMVSWRPLTLVAIAAATAGAGHFVGFYLAIQTFGSDEARSRGAAHAIEFLASGVGLTQVCFAVVMFAALPEAGSAAVLAMLLVNALAIEIQAPLNRRAISGFGRSAV